MKEYYQPKGGKKGKFALRENTYRRTWYLIADYKYFKYIQAGLTQAEHWSRTEGAAGRVADPGNGYAAEKDQISRYIKAIETAQRQVPEAYVDSIMSHIIERKKYKDIEGVSERTLKIWVQRFIWHVAHNLGEV